MPVTEALPCEEVAAADGTHRHRLRILGAEADDHPTAGGAIPVSPHNATANGREGRLGPGGRGATPVTVGGEVVAVLDVEFSKRVFASEEAEAIEAEAVRLADELAPYV